MTPANITIYQFVNLCDHKMYRKSDQKRTYQKLYWYQFTQTILLFLFQVSRPKNMYDYSFY